MKIVPPSVTLVWMTPFPLQVIEQIARTCYKSEEQMNPAKSGDWIKKRLIAPGHHAMLEHASASLKFVTDRGVTHELVRHRLCAFAQESTRYCNYGKEAFDGVTFIEPPNLALGSYGTWIEACNNAERQYLQMLEDGCAPQIARAVLPNCLKTEIVCTANMREWRHIFTMRCPKTAHPQIRQIMWAALDLLSVEAGPLFEDLDLGPRPEGTPGICGAVPAC